ncbi:MAG TPA: hypothetical protein ENJ78_01285, partial [candidate division WWE3 bacterium]|nr:hypothetical protein [candidate division WWE3 bacterium]
MLLFKGSNFLAELDLILKNKCEKVETDKKLAVLHLLPTPSSKKFIALKKKVASQYDIEVKVYNFTEKTPKRKVYDTLKSLNEDDTVGGIVVQYPFPEKYTFADISTRINPLKDVDFFTDKTYGGFSLNLFPDFMPPVVRSLDYFLNTYKLELKGKRYIILGQGHLVGKPVATYLINREATVYSLNEFSPKIESTLKKADVVISATGNPNILKPHILKKGASVIDFGYGFVDSKPVGDLDMSEDISHLNIVSPSPGG